MSVRVLSPFKNVFGVERIVRTLSNKVPPKTENTTGIIRDSEIEHHSKLAGEWWDTNGGLKLLHSLNTLRVPLVGDCLFSTGKINSSLYNTSKVLQNQKILEVGCGGGIFSEGLARLHADVTAIDLSEELINVAQQHLAEFSPELSSRLTYKVEPVDMHAMNNREKYDAVVICEVIEHIENKEPFLRACVDALKPGGSIILTTFNRTVILWLTGIFLSEYVFKIIPKGTHHWDKLISPEDLRKMLNDLDCNTVLSKGFIYLIWSNSWKWIPFDNLSYAMHAIKAKKP